MSSGRYENTCSLETYGTNITNYEYPSYAIYNCSGNDFTISSCDTSMILTVPSYFSLLLTIDQQKFFIAQKPQSHLLCSFI